MWSGLQDMDPVVLWALITVLCSSLLISAIRQVKVYMYKRGPLPETCEPDGSWSACELERHVQQQRDQKARARPSSFDASCLRAGVYKASQPSRQLFSSKTRSHSVHVPDTQVGQATAENYAGSQAQGPGVCTKGIRRTSYSSEGPVSSAETLWPFGALPSTLACDTHRNAPATAPGVPTGSSEQMSPGGLLPRSGSPLSLSRGLVRSKSFERMVANDRECPMTPPPRPIAAGRRSRSDLNAPSSKHQARLLPRSKSFEQKIKNED